MALFSHLLLLFCSLPLLIIAQNNGSIPFESPLTASRNEFSSSWLSPSGDFAFGFRKLESTNDFLLAIWIDNIPDKTIVWYSNGSNPAPLRSTVKLTAESGLVLTNPQGEELWRSDFSSIGLVARGIINDTGNLVLEDEKSQELWSSFANPTDTLLPTQSMERGGVLSSRQSEKNFSKGRFQLRLLDNGNLVLNSINLPTGNAYAAYYISGTYDPQSSSNSGYRLTFNESGYMYILRENGIRFDLTSGSLFNSRDFYHLAVLHFDGVFVQYRYPKRDAGSGRSWTRVWFQPDNVCVDIGSELGSGACGFNNVCTLDTESRRPNCKCPQGFSLIDENNVYGDCKPDFEVSSCVSDDHNNRAGEDFYELISIQRTDWPTSDYEQYKPYDEKSCQISCLRDCFCAVAIFRGDSCWKKKYPLSNGRNDTSVNGQAYIKVPKNGNGGISPRENPSPENPKENNRRQGLFITGSVLLGGSVFINFILIGFFGISFFYMNNKRRVSRNHGGDSSMESNLRVFTFSEVVEATGEFKEEIGRGAFGIVYKGELKMNYCADNVTVAVKKLDRVLQEGEKEFRNEVNVIGQTHHKNLVKLLGFCNEGQNRLIVYEFLPNGTLANFLFANPKPSWKQRTRIAMGIARGILYLHEECSTQIIHCDIKPQNILLDERFNARISDFGLAKLLMLNQTHTQTGIRGTKGYVAPEWFRNNPITTKVDVFSYGVLLLEIVCCKKSVQYDVDSENNIMILTDWAYDCFQYGMLEYLVEGDEEAAGDMITVERFVKVAIWCIQEEPSIRPSMRRVNQMLEGVAEVGVPPSPSPYQGDLTATTTDTS